MKVCAHKGLLIAILTRNEHCPPHVHTGSDKWEARFEFGFWHDSVSLWDAVPVQNKPTAGVLEDLRQIIKQPANLRRAREIWWNSLQTVCLVNQLWDTDFDEAVNVKDGRPSTCVINAARFDGQSYKTVLQLAGRSSPLEIEL